MPVNEHALRLRSGDIDIAYGHRAERSEGVHFQLLSSEPLLLALPANHRLAKLRIIEIASLSAEPFVFWHRSIAPSCHDKIIETVVSRGISAKPKHMAPDHAKLLDMVAAGLGWSVTPACVRKSRQPGVKFRRISEVNTKIDIGISYLAANRDQTVRAVLDLWNSLP
jgi:DNA-binding transcriptional LysR family regulator